MNELEDLEMDDVFSFDDDKEPSSGSLTSSSASSDTPEIMPAMTATLVDAAANGAVGDGVTASATASGITGSERSTFLKLMKINSCKRC